MQVLAVDTCLGACSAALLVDRRVLAHRFALMDRGHAEALAPMIAEVLAGQEIAAIDRVAVTTGPGTFTGQRIGMAFMRGLRMALDVPLIGITSLAAMAAQAKFEEGTSRAAALHDAKRGEVYFEMDEGPLLLPFAEAIAMLESKAGLSPISLAGTGAPRAHSALGDGFVLSGVRQPDAMWVGRLARDAPSTLSVPQPLYLRAPDARLRGMP